MMLRTSAKKPEQLSIGNTNKLVEIAPIKRQRPILSSSTLNSLNIEIAKYNELINTEEKYKTLSKIYFKVKSKLANSETKEDNQAALETWLQKNLIEEKLKILMLHSLQAQLTPETNAPTNDNHKILIKLLLELSERIKQSPLPIFKDNHFELFVNFVTTELKHSDQIQYPLINNIINKVIDIQSMLFHLLNSKIKNEEINKLKKIYDLCDDALDECVKSAKFNNHDNLLYHLITNKLSLSPATNDSLNRFDGQTFQAFMEKASNFFAHHKITTEFLGGHTNQVYKLFFQDTHLIVKIYPCHDEEYFCSYQKLIQVRNKLGQDASLFIGNIYAEKEFISFKADENGPVYRGRMEIAEYFPEGNMEQRIQEFGKYEHLVKLQDFANDVKDNILNTALQIVRLINRLNKLNITFPDIKPSNFFLKNDKAIIPDYKSLFLIDETNSHVPLQNIAYTKEYLAPEIIQLETQLYSQNSKNPVLCNVIDMQKYALGLTLYELTTSDLSYKLEKSKRQPNFAHRIFKDDKGKILLDVIQSLMNDQPDKRMNFNEAAARLEDAIHLKHTHSHHKCRKHESSPLFFRHNQSESPPSTRSNSQHETPVISHTDSDNQLMKSCKSNI